MNRMPIEPRDDMQRRHLDNGQYLNDFADEVWVKCIRCATPGLVHGHRAGAWHWHATFQCKSCELTLDSANGDWVGPVDVTGKRPCGYCGHQWLAPRIRQEDWPRSVLTSIEKECVSCHRVSTVSLSTEPDRYGKPDGRDPHFGMHLWLMDSGPHGALWVYNAAHLQTLRTYIAAMLRERTRSAGNTSLISRLPAWMKAAKNRDGLTKRLAKLERQLTEASQL